MNRSNRWRSLKALRRLRAAVAALENDDELGLLPTDTNFWKEVKQLGARIDGLTCPDVPALTEDWEADEMPSASTPLAPQTGTTEGDGVTRPLDGSPQSGVTELSDMWRRELADIWGS